MRKVSTKDLIGGLKKGEPWAIKEMYSIAFPSVAILTIRNSGTMEDAKDLFQETMLTMIRKLREPDFKLTAHPKTFVYAIARNQWFNQLRAKKNNPVDLILDETETGIQISALDESLMKFELPGFDENDRVQIVTKEKFALLSDKCKQVINMKYVYGMSHEDITEETGDTILYSRQRLRNCINQLRKWILKEI